MCYSALHNLRNFGTSSVEDYIFEGPPKEFRRDYIDKVSMLVPLWQQQMKELTDIKRRAQRERQEAAWVVNMGKDCNVLAYRLDNQVLRVYKQPNKTECAASSSTS